VGHGDLAELQKTDKEFTVTLDDVVPTVAGFAKPVFESYLLSQSEEMRLRLDGLEGLLRPLFYALEGAFWKLTFDWLGEQAERVAGTCTVCRRRCTRHHGAVPVVVLGRSVEVDAVRFYCRPCKRSRSPIRDWLGIESGMASAEFERAVTSFSSEMSFGKSAQQMKEHHHQDVDRTRIERTTYSVGRDAVEYLGERRKRAHDAVAEYEGVRPGVERIILTADGGGVPVGELRRPDPEEAESFTPVRGLPVGKKVKTTREVRLVRAWKDGVATGQIVDLHIAPHNQTEVSGERMFAAAVETGLGDNTLVHGVFDMGTWIRTQFLEQFSAYPHSMCADFFHTTEYVSDAGRAFHPQGDERKAWLGVQAHSLKAGDRQAILDALRKHTCADDGVGCPKTDRGECAVVVGRRYLTRFGEFMTYPEFLADGLPIGSGAAEGGIRHLVRRRLDVPGDWREENVALVAALVSVRESGWWDDFWRWRDTKDRARFRNRMLGIGRNRFRGRSRNPAPPTQPETAAHVATIDAPDYFDTHYSN